VKRHIGTRTSAQIRSHAQKYDQKGTIKSKYEPIQIYTSTKKQSHKPSIVQKVNKEEPSNIPTIVQAKLVGQSNKLLEKTKCEELSSNIALDLGAASKNKQVLSLINSQITIQNNTRVTQPGNSHELDGNAFHDKELNDLRNEKDVIMQEIGQATQEILGIEMECIEITNSLFNIMPNIALGT